MRLLLDTHAMYWYIEGDPQLSGTARTCGKGSGTLSRIGS